MKPRSEQYIIELRLLEYVVDTLILIYLIERLPPERDEFKAL
jgi:hypothetical protein